MRRTNKRLGLWSAAVALVVLAVAAPEARAASRQFRYVANEDEAHIVYSGAVPTPLGTKVAPRGMFSVTPTGTSITIRIDDAAATLGHLPVGASIRNRWLFNGCVASGATTTIAGTSHSEPVTIRIGATPGGRYSSYAHCNGVATSGLATVTGIK